MSGQKQPAFHYTYLKSLKLGFSYRCLLVCVTIKFYVQIFLSATNSVTSQQAVKSLKAEMA